MEDVYVKGSQLFSLPFTDLGGDAFLAGGKEQLSSVLFTAKKGIEERGVFALFCTGIRDTVWNEGAGVESR